MTRRAVDASRCIEKESCTLPIFATDAGSDVRADGVSTIVPEPDKKPSHYKVICISIYTKDLEKLDHKVEELKALGHTRANRSSVIRAALAHFPNEKYRPDY